MTVCWVQVMICRQTALIAWMLSQAVRAGVGGGFGEVEVDAAAERVRAAGEYQDGGVLGDGVAQRGRETAAVSGAHGPVVEVEGEPADCGGASVRHLLVGGRGSGLVGCGESQVGDVA